MGVATELECFGGPLDGSKRPLDGTAWQDKGAILGNPGLIPWRRWDGEIVGEYVAVFSGIRHWHWRRN